MSTGLIFEKVRTKEEVLHRIHPTLRQEIFEYVFYFLRVFVTVTLVFVVVKTQIYQVTNIEGKSMFPSLDNGDIVFIDLLTPKFGDYRRGDIVVIKPPLELGTQNKYLIKRIIGLPGETVGTENGNVIVTNSSYSSGIILNEKSYLAPDIKTYKTSSTGKEKFVFTKLGDQEYFLLGDNRGGSTDSRVFGGIKKSQILGREFYRSFPSKQAGSPKLPTYNINN
jgi:signal peptidase I